MLDHINSPTAEIPRSFALSGKETLNLGCGRKHLPTAVNLDISRATQPDILHDLNRLPWPFNESQFKEVVAFDVIEHIENVVTAMEEIHRVSQHNAVVRIAVPHFSSSNSFTDPTHRHLFGVESFDYFTEGHELSFYTNAKYQKLVSRIVFAPTVLNKLVWRFANRYPSEYERRWAWIFPAWFLYFELQVLKVDTTSA